jgi:high-affinity iron transporter
MVFGLLLVLPASASAREVAAWEAGESIRALLFDAQRLLFTAARADQPDAVFADARLLLDEAAVAYRDQLQPAAAGLASEADAAVMAAFSAGQTALTAEDAAAFASARGQVWTNLLWVSYEVTHAALRQGDTSAATNWLALREYRQATSVSVVDSSAARALRAAERGELTRDEALVIVGNDLRDAYYFRLRDALNEMEVALRDGYRVRAAEWAGQARGYFNILRADFLAKHGEAEAAAAAAALAQLETETLSQAPAVAASLAAARQQLARYQPVELSPDLIAERGRLLYLFLDLVAVEYRDGVRDGQITIPIEYQEATTFFAQSRSLYEELRPVMIAADPVGAERIDGLLTEIEAIMSNLGDSVALQAAVSESLQIIQTSLQVDVTSGDVAATFTVIDTLLDEVTAAAAAGRYDDAERTRIEAYGLFESGPELRLANRAPLLTREIEGLFWEGSGGVAGLYTQLHQEADARAVRAAVDAVRIRLDEAETFLGETLTTPLAALNSAIIILREGLEAVLIIGAILAYMFKTGAPRRFIAWVFAGVGAALALSVATWFAAETFLTITPVQRELIEGVTSLIAVAVLFYVTNWLFHKLYVTDWMRFIREQADKALNNGRALGLAALGFTVVYREGLETVLFYQALLFDADPAPVLLGFAVGLAFILVIAYVMLRLSRRLPLKPLFTVTTILLLLLAFSFTGAAVRELQEAGAVSATLLPWLPENLVLMEVFGLFPTLETVLAQVIFTALIASTFMYSRWQGSREAVAALQKSKSQEVHS